MKTDDFDFELPDEQIAQYPPEERGTCRLLHLNKNSGQIQHKNMKDLPDLIEEGSVIVLNDSKVRKVRLFAKSKISGGKIEVFLLKRINDTTWEAMVSKSKKQKVGKEYIFNDGMEAVIEKDLGTNQRLLKFSSEVTSQWLDSNGHIPLPPYIKRDDNNDDALRYQSIFAKEDGSAAAPTASLHFTEEIIDSLKAKGVEVEFITLHVGLGTFAPVRTDNIEDHEMHSEEYYISKKTASILNKAKDEGRKIIAVGTTALRTLESAWKDNSIKSGWDSTSIFIYPGYKFKVVDKLFTNFHTPQSTLLMLVSALSSKKMIMDSYEEAIKKGYMFFSYGDAMFID